MGGGPIIINRNNTERFYTFDSHPNLVENMTKSYTCECGQAFAGEDESLLISAVQEHQKRIHGKMAKEGRIRAGIREEAQAEEQFG